MKFCTHVPLINTSGVFSPFFPSPKKSPSLNIVRLLSNLVCMFCTTILKESYLQLSVIPPHSPPGGESAPKIHHLETLSDCLEIWEACFLLQYWRKGFVSFPKFSPFLPIEGFPPKTPPRQNIVRLSWNLECKSCTTIHRGGFCIFFKILPPPKFTILKHCQTG